MKGSKSSESLLGNKSTRRRSQYQNKQKVTAGGLPTNTKKYEKENINNNFNNTQNLKSLLPALSNTSPFTTGNAFGDNSKKYENRSNTAMSNSNTNNGKKTNARVSRYSD